MTNPIQELVPTLIAYGVVACLAIPLAVATAIYAGRRELFPRWKRERVAWDGGMILLFFILGMIIYPALNVPIASAFQKVIYGPDLEALPHSRAGSGVEPEKFFLGLWLQTFACSNLLVTAVIFHYFALGKVTFPGLRTISARVSLGAMTWIIAVPIVFAVYLLVLELLLAAGRTPTQHPLAGIEIGARFFDKVFFFFVPCVVAPLLEEFLCRSLLVRWGMRRTYRPTIVVVASCCIAFSQCSNDMTPFWYTCGIGGVVLVIQRVGRGRIRFARRAWTSVGASSVFFAALHSSVWPSPIPLFVLALFLGWIAVRTGGITGCVVLHGLFNAVSCVEMLNHS